MHGDLIMDTTASNTIKLWLRLEVFEHGILHFPSRYNACLTPDNVQRVLQSMSMETHDNVVTYAVWQEAAQDIFRWHEIEYKTFWDVLLFFHDMYLERTETNGHRKSVSSIEQLVPLNELAIFLFIHTDKPATFRSKESLEAYNDVWYANDDQVMQHSAMDRQEGQTSPHCIGLKQKSMTDVHFLSFITQNLDSLISTVYPLQSAEDQRTQLLLSTQDVDLLGFIFAGSPSGAAVEESVSLSQLVQSKQDKVSVAHLTQWLRQYLGSNETLYPPLGASAKAPGFWKTGTDEDGVDDASDKNQNTVELHGPVVLNYISKYTIVRTQPNDFTTAEPEFDVLLYSCHDAFIYLLSPIRSINIVACSNCVIALGPSKGVLSLDRCEKLRVSAATGMLRVSNCLDSVFNVYTQQSPILMGDNRGIQLGPYNTVYPHLREHLSQVGIDLPIVHFDEHGAPTGGEWYNFINLNTDDDADGSEKEAVVLQPPDTFVELAVPVKIEKSNVDTVCPVPLPPDYAKVAQKKADTVERLRAQLMGNSKLNAAARRDIDGALQTKFKEWLISSGNLRQVSDLIQLERANSPTRTSTHVFSTRSAAANL